MHIFRNKNGFLYRLVRHYFEHGIATASAEMAYYLIFAFFPLLMVIHASVSMAFRGFNIQGTFFYALLPEVVEQLLDVYIEHIGANSNLSFLVLGIILTVYTLSKFMKSAKRTIRRIYGSVIKTPPLSDWTLSVILSILFLVAFYVCLVVVILGEHILSFIRNTLPFLHILPIEDISRFVFTGAVIYTFVTPFYLWIPGVKQDLWKIFPGTLFTSVGWVLVSAGFSFYMNNFSNYSIIYGSIGAFIMLLLWIYVLCMILLLGAAVNAVLYTTPISHRKKDSHANKR